MSTTVTTTTSRTSGTAPLSGGSNRLRSRMPEEKAVAGLRDRMVIPQRVEFLSRDEASEIMQLAPHSTLRDAQRGVTQRTTSPEAFFGQWKIKPGAFNADDVKELYRMMSSHPMSDRISFYPLLGLEFCDLLGQLNALEQYLSPDLRKKCVELWQEKYLDTFGCLSVLGNGGDLIYAEQQGTRINTFDHYLEEVRRLSQGELDDRKTSKSPVAQRLLQKGYDQQVQPVLQKFDRTLKLLQKFLTHPRSKDLLYDSMLQDCLGIRQVMPFSNPAEARIAGQNICKYASFLAGCVDSSSEMPEDIAAFMSPLRKMQHNPFHAAKPLKQIVKWSNERMGEVWLSLLAIEALFNKENRDPSPMDPQRKCMINSCMSWLQDITNVFEYTILPIVNPMHTLQRSHDFRLMFNLLKYSTGSEILNDPLIDPEKTIEAPEFDRIYHEMMGDFQEIAHICWNAFEKRGEGLRLDRGVTLNVAIPEELKQFSLQINQWTDNALKQLSGYLRDHAGEMHELPVLDMTIELARAFLMKNDLDMVLYGENPWAYEMPQEYLDLVLLEFAQTPAQAPVVVHAPVEAEPVNPPLQEAFEIKGPPPAEAPPPTEPKPPQGAAPAAKPKAAPSTDPRDLGLKRGMYADQIQRVLARLGLKSIPGGNGSHRHVVDSEGKIVTVIKGHGTISPGGLHDVQTKVADYFEQKSAGLPAPSTTGRRKKK